MSYVDVGSLRDRIQILDCRMTEDKVYEWVPLRPGWAKVEVDGLRNYFSTVGVNRQNAKIIMRRQNLTPHYALRCRGQHFFITQLNKHPSEREYMEVKAALVTVDTMELMEDEQTVSMTFPSVLTEKYVKHAQEWPMSVNDMSLVAVVPKVIALKPGSLVRVRGDLWEVCVPHELDEFKNEYEIRRLVDL